MNNGKEEKIKIILLGEPSTGKTSLIKVYLNDKFTEDVPSSLSSSFFQSVITVNEKKYLIDLWDTVGQENYRSITQHFIRDTNIVIFVYDITEKHTFNEIENYWIDKVKEVLNDSAILGIAGNKEDLYEKEVVEEDKAEKLAKKIGGFFKKTSAKENPKEFKTFVKMLIEQFLLKNNKIIKGNNIILNESSIIEDKNKKKKCCI